MKILVINAGSSSLKFQLIDMENEKVIAKGICEEIGGKSSFKFKVPGKEDYKTEGALPTHGEALQLVLDTLVDPEIGVIASVDEIGYHRGVLRPWPSSQPREPQGYRRV